MRNFSLKNCRDKSREIANDPAAKPDDKRLSIQALRNHLVANCAGLLERLRLLACRNRDENRIESRRL